MGSSKPGSLVVMSGSGLHFAPVFDLKELPDHQLQPLLVTAQLVEVTAQDAAAGTTTVKCNKYGQVTLPDKLVAVVLDADLPAQGPQAAAERAGVVTLRLLGDGVYDGITNVEKVKASAGLLNTMRYRRDVIHHDEQHSRSPAKPPSCAMHKRPRQPSSPGAVTPFLGGAPNKRRTGWRQRAPHRELGADSRGRRQTGEQRPHSGTHLRSTEVFFCPSGEGTVQYGWYGMLHSQERQERALFDIQRIQLCLLVEPIVS